MSPTPSCPNDPAEPTASPDGCSLPQATALVTHLPSDYNPLHLMAYAEPERLADSLRLLTKNHQKPELATKIRRWCQEKDPQGRLPAHCLWDDTCVLVRNHHLATVATDSVKEEIITKVWLSNLRNCWESQQLLLDTMGNGAMWQTSLQGTSVMDLILKRIEQGQAFVFRKMSAGQLVEAEIRRRALASALPDAPGTLRAAHGPRL